jgi:FkbM family methyltransferase
VAVDKEHSFKMKHYGHMIENNLFWKGLYGNWEQNSLKTWALLCSNSKIIFDIGANTGVYSMVAGAVNPLASVHAFEPFTAIYKKLQANITLNGFDTKANCVAVSNFTGDAVIYSEDPEFAYSVTVNQNLWAKGKEVTEIKIKTITLKDYIESNAISGIDLMKIDVETHEPEVMEGFGKYFLEFKPVVLIEVLNDDVVNKLNIFFSASTGQRIFQVNEENGLVPVDALCKSEHNNFLIVPEEKMEMVKHSVLDVINTI